MALIVLTIGVLATLVIALLAIKKNLRSQTNQLFALLAIALSGWSVATYLSLFESQWQLDLVRLTMLFVVLINTSFYFLLRVFPKRRVVFATISRLYVVLAVVAMAAAMSPWMFTHLEVVDGEVGPVPGPGMAVFMLHTAVFAVSSLVLLIKRTKQSKGLERLQLRYVTLGLFAYIFLTPLTNFVLPVIFQQSSLVHLSPINSALFATFVGYAIVQHRLMDIRIVLVRSVTYLLVLLTMGGLYALVVFSVVDQMFAENQMGTMQRLAYMLAAMMLAFTFQPLKRFFDKVTDRIFFRNRYSLEDLVADVTNNTASTLDLNLLAETTLQRLADGMRVDQASMWAVEEGDFYCAAYRNLTLADLDTFEPELLLDMVAAVRHPVVVADELGGRYGRLLKRHHVEVAVVLQASGSLQGMILLGAKQSGEVYTDQDINALRIIGPSLAIGLENASSYKRIQEFSQTLEREVDKATHELTVANEKLSRSNAKLRQLDSLKDEFISITSHELRTPLTAIRGYLWMAMNKGKGNSSSREDKGWGYLERAYISTERLIDLVNDSLDISRIDSGRVQLSPEATDIFLLAEEVVTDLMPRVEQQGQKLDLVKPKVALPAVMVDPEKLYQVLTNLVGNAIKFTPDGGSISVSFKKNPDGKVVTIISDTGPGISQEDQKRLFQKFSRLDAAATIPGTGLGLFLCREIIRLSKGRIWVESKVGEGSSFIFTLPSTKEKPTAPDGERRHAARLISAAQR